MNKLPSMEHTFLIDVEGKETREKKIGEFTYKRPNIGDKIEISKMTTRLNGDLQNIPLEVTLLNEMRAMLCVCLIKAPDWWVESEHGRKLYDLNIIEEIYGQCMKFEKEYYESVWGKKDGDAPKS